MIRNGLIVLLLVFFNGVSIAQLPYQNNSLSANERAEDLLERLTLEEKVLLMQDQSQAIERLGIKTYNWWNEALHGVARAGEATVFPQPIGMAASFDKEAVFNVFSAVSDEARAKHSNYSAQGQYGRYFGLTMWTPTINIVRDPRWGRGMESYGEDPYLVGEMGVAVVKALQGPRDRKYDKLHACAKHFAVHSGPEWNRHSFDAKGIKKRDLHETYLPAFEALIKDADVRMVMCAYNRFEGEPCCGSSQLMVKILREDWGFNGVVVADCGAINDFYREDAHATHPDSASAAAQAVLNGTDLDCGSSYAALVESVKKGYISEHELDVSVKRLLKARFELGEMDSNHLVEWTKIPYSVVCSPEHDSLALDIARRSMTLLYNRNNILPLKRGGLKLAVVGPNAKDPLMQWGNYYGTAQRTITILEGIRLALGTTDQLIYEKGCELVERDVFQSAFDQCRTEKGTGFSAKYWNNVFMEGEPVAISQVLSPFSFCTSGSTAFEPGVNLTNFSALFESTFIPEKSDEVLFQFFSNGITSMLINGEEVWHFQANHGNRQQEYKMDVKKGEPYQIEIRFAYWRPDAGLNFKMGFKQEIDLQETVKRLKESDVIIFVGGISPFLEGEQLGVNLPGFNGGDRTTLELPQVQRDLIAALQQAGKPIILVNCSGSAIALGSETQVCEAILQAWYPGQAGGTAVAEVLFGDYNPAGRLPVTFYKSVDQLPDFEDYNMTGRTYRYMNDEPLFPFGHGLSYTTFHYGKPKLKKNQIKLGETLELTVPLNNSGERHGEEVIQVYLKKEGDMQGPAKTLRAFKRVFVPAGESINVVFQLNENLEWWNEDNNSVTVHPGDYQLMVGGSSRDEELQIVNFKIQ